MARKNTNGLLDVKFSELNLGEATPTGPQRQRNPSKFHTSNMAGESVPRGVMENTGMSRHSEIITAIFQKCVTNVSLIGTMPLLFNENPQDVKKFFSDEEAQLLRESLKEDPNQTSLDEIPTPTPIADIVIPDVPLIDWDVEQYYELMVHNEKLIQKLAKLEHVQPTIESLILGMYNTLSVFMQELEKPISDIKKHKNLMKNIEDEINRRRDCILQMANQLNEYINEQRRCIHKRTEQISRLQDQLERNRLVFRHEYNTLINCLDRAIEEAEDRGEQDLAEVQRTAAESNLDLADLAAANIDNENSLRGQSTALREQLSQWLARYYQDSIERQNQLDALNEMCDADTDEFAELDAIVTQQEEEFERYKKQREEEELRLFNERLFEFRSMRAARTLQRAWRGYHGRQRRRRRRNARKAAATRAH